MPKVTISMKSLAMPTPWTALLGAVFSKAVAARPAIPSSFPTHPGFFSCPNNGHKWFVDDSVYGGRYAIECGIDYYGGDIQGQSPQQVLSFNDCLQVCNALPRCIAVSFVEVNDGSDKYFCYPKDTIDSKLANSTIIGAAVQLLPDRSPLALTAHAKSALTASTTVGSSSPTSAALSTLSSGSVASSSGRDEMTSAFISSATTGFSEVLASTSVSGTLGSTVASSTGVMSSRSRFRTQELSTSVPRGSWSTVSDAPESSTLKKSGPTVTMSSISASRTLELNKWEMGASAAVLKASRSTVSGPSTVSIASSTLNSNSTSHASMSSVRPTMAKQPSTSSSSESAGSKPISSMPWIPRPTKSIIMKLSSTLSFNASVSSTPTLPRPSTPKPTKSILMTPSDPSVSMSEFSASSEGSNSSSVAFTSSVTSASYVLPSSTTRSSAVPSSVSMKTPIYPTEVKTVRWDLLWKPQPETTVTNPVSTPMALNAPETTMESSSVPNVAWPSISNLPGHLETTPLRPKTPKSTIVASSDLWPGNSKLSGHLQNSIPSHTPSSVNVDFSIVSLSTSTTIELTMPWRSRPTGIEDSEIANGSGPLWKSTVTSPSVFKSHSMEMTVSKTGTPIEPNAGSLFTSTATSSGAELTSDIETWETFSNLPALTSSGGPSPEPTSASITISVQTMLWTTKNIFNEPLTYTISKITHTKSALPSSTTGASLSNGKTTLASHPAAISTWSYNDEVEKTSVDGGEPFTSVKISSPTKSATLSHETQVTVVKSTTLVSQTERITPLSVKAPTVTPPTEKIVSAMETVPGKDGQKIAVAPITTTARAASPTIAVSDETLVPEALPLLRSAASGTKIPRMLAMGLLVVAGFFFSL